MLLKKISGDIKKKLCRKAFDAVPLDVWTHDRRTDGSGVSTTIDLSYGVFSYCYFAPYACAFGARGAPP